MLTVYLLLFIVRWAVGKAAMSSEPAHQGGKETRQRMMGSDSIYTGAKLHNSDQWTRGSAAMCCSTF